MVKKYAFDGVRFAKDLHNERWGRGEGVREVAHNIGCSPSTVSRWERALNEPPIVIFLVACGVYGLNPLNYLMEESGDQPALPGFEALANVPLVPMSQQEFSEFFNDDQDSEIGRLNWNEDQDRFDTLTGTYR